MKQTTIASFGALFLWPASIHQPPLFSPGRRADVMVHQILATEEFVNNAVAGGGGGAVDAYIKTETNSFLNIQYI